MTRPRYQGSEAWLAERRGGIGASDVPTLISGSEEQWRTLFAEKLGLIDAQPGSETMEWGKRLEDAIAAAYSERTGHRVQRVDRVLRHRELDFVRASLDRRRKGAVVELKKYGFPTADFGPDGSDQVPDAWAYQVQQQLAVTGLPLADIAVLFGGRELRIYTLGRDQTEIDAILALEQRAWAYVQRGEIPPYPGPAPVRPHLAADEIEADEAIANWAALAHQAGEAKAAAEAEEKEARDHLRALLADVGGARGQLPDGRRLLISHRPNKDSTVVAWEQVANAYRKAAVDSGADPEQLAALQELFTTTKPGIRPIRITIGKGELIHAA